MSVKEAEVTLVAEFHSMPESKRSFKFRAPFGFSCLLTRYLPRAPVLRLNSPRSIFDRLGDCLLGHALV
jgi:hypothetical protein